MFEEPDESAAEESSDPSRRAEEHSARLRMHAELAAVFEGPRKFSAELHNFPSNEARDIQRTIGKLEKSRDADSPLIPQDHANDAATILKLGEADERNSGDYFIARRPGEVIIIRWLWGEAVDEFYGRLQAHFDAAMGAFRDDERTSKEWKRDPQTLKYLEALDLIEVKMDQRYLREVIKQHRVFLMTTQTADEINIEYLCQTIMGLSVTEVVGNQSAPPDEPTEQDLAWFFKLFSLRGIVENVEQLCFFAFLQKADEGFE